jgi:hypothetical protein
MRRKKLHSLGRLLGQKKLNACLKARSWLREKKFRTFQEAWLALGKINTQPKCTWRGWLIDAIRSKAYSAALGYFSIEGAVATDERKRYKALYDEVVKIELDRCDEPDRKIAPRVEKALYTLAVLKGWIDAPLLDEPKPEQKPEEEPKLEPTIAQYTSSNPATALGHE